MAKYPKRSCNDPTKISRSANGLWCNTCCCPQYPVDVYLVHGYTEEYMDDMGVIIRYTYAEYEAYDACGRLVFSNAWYVDGIGNPWLYTPCGLYYQGTLYDINSACIPVTYDSIDLGYTVCPGDLSCEPPCVTCYCGYGY